LDILRPYWNFLLGLPRTRKLPGPNTKLGVGQRPLRNYGQLAQPSRGLSQRGIQPGVKHGLFNAPYLSHQGFWSNPLRITWLNYFGNPHFHGRCQGLAFYTPLVQFGRAPFGPAQHWFGPISQFGEPNPLLP